MAGQQEEDKKEADVVYDAAPKGIKRPFAEIPIGEVSVAQANPQDRMEICSSLHLSSGLLEVLGFEIEHKTKRNILAGGFQFCGFVRPGLPPAGAPMTFIDRQDGQRNFAVVDGFQLHGDLGERIGLKRKCKKYKEKIQEVYGPAAVKGQGLICLGDVCPVWYERFPEN